MAKKAKEASGGAAAAPEQIDELDALKYELAVTRSQLLDAQKQLLDTQKQLLEVQHQALRGQSDVLVRGLNEKYKLGAEDRVDISTRVITRAPQPAPAPQPSAVVPQA